MKALALIHALDSSLISKIFQTRLHPHLIPLARILSATADGWLYLLTAVVIYWMQGHQSLLLLGLLLGFAMERPTYTVLKNVLKRNRPFQVLPIKNVIIPSDYFSFPSGHTCAAFLFTTLIIQSIPWLMIPMLIWATLVGCSRVILGVHYPTDILMGALLGITLGQFSMYLLS